jgi:hypothetical protein
MKKTIFLFLIQLSLIGNVVCQNFKIKGLEIANGDLAGFANGFKFSNSSRGEYTYDQAQLYMAEHSKWRLPTIDEIIVLAENKESLNMDGEFYLCYGRSKGHVLPDILQKKSIFENTKNYYFIVNIKAKENGYPIFIQTTLSTAGQMSGNIRLVKKSSKLNKDNNSEKNNTDEKSESIVLSSNQKITTYSGSYGLSGSTFSNSDIQFQLECSAPFNKARLSSGMKWRFFLNQYSGLNVEGFGRIYTGKQSKMFYSNNRLYIQAKIGYGLVKPKEDSFTTQYNYREKSTFSPLAGLGIGYKFILKERIVFDLLLGYHYQSTPKFSSTDIDYTAYQKTKWKDNIASPVEFQWGIGFLIK